MCTCRVREKENLTLCQTLQYDHLVAAGLVSDMTHTLRSNPQCPLALMEK